jgi:hypothetical protein
VVKEQALRDLSASFLLTSQTEINYQNRCDELLEESATARRFDSSRFFDVYGCWLSPAIVTSYHGTLIYPTTGACLDLLFRMVASSSRVGQFEWAVEQNGTGLRYVQWLSRIGTEVASTLGDEPVEDPEGVEEVTVCQKWKRGFCVARTTLSSRTSKLI